jgi:choline dehydrogenase-like flavoprotein
MEIHANMLTDPRDLAALRRSMEITRELGNSEAMKPFIKREILPGDLEGEALDNLIRDGAMSMHHPTCTAKMGQDDLSVVDAQLFALPCLLVYAQSPQALPRSDARRSPCVASPDLAFRCAPSLQISLLQLCTQTFGTLQK